MLRTISCGEVRKDHIGSRVELAGWVDRRRDHGNLIFIDLRDREGLVQVVFNPETAPEQHAVAERLRSEWVVQVGGLVRARPEGAENPKLATGAIEVAAESVEVVLKALVSHNFAIPADTMPVHRSMSLRRSPSSEPAVPRVEAPDGSDRAEVWVRIGETDVEFQMQFVPRPPGLLGDLDESLLSGGTSSQGGGG